MRLSTALRGWWWLIWKDLLREYRVPRVGPAMLVLGLVVVLMLSLQVHLPPAQQRDLQGGLFWITMFLAGTLVLERSVAGEREAECWPALFLYPVDPGTVFLAKTTVSFVALSLLALILAPALAVFTGVPWGGRPAPLAGIILCANLGYAAVGTAVSAITHGMAHRGNLLALLQLPLTSPVLLAASQATRAVLAGNEQDWQHLLLFLGCFAGLFVTLGALLFSWITEE